MAKDSQGFLVQGESLRRMADATRLVETGRPRPFDRGAGDKVAMRVLEVLLTSDVALCDNPAVPTTGTAQVQTVGKDVDTLSALPAGGGGGIITVRNRWPSAFKTGDYAVVEELYDNRWFLRGTGGTPVIWGYLNCDSGSTDNMQLISTFGTAGFFDGHYVEIPASGSCGSGSGSPPQCEFSDYSLDELGLVVHDGETVVYAIVPAGYKKGPVILMKMPIYEGETVGSGTGSGLSGSGGPLWEGWVLIWGARMKTIIRTPTYSCCPSTNTLKLTKEVCTWVIGGDIGSISTPCSSIGSGSGSAP